PSTPEQTFFDGVSALPAASYCVIDLTSSSPRLEFHTFWTLGAARGSDRHRYRRYRRKTGTHAQLPYHLEIIMKTVSNNSSPQHPGDGKSIR
ncbi:MAG: hypothetical protein ACXWD3_06375, partial [Mycobacterium sp.]